MVSERCYSGERCAAHRHDGDPSHGGHRGAAASATQVAATATMATLQPWLVLSQGRNSAWPPVTVRSLQYLLNARGARLAVDGIFGPRTRAAVIAFQRGMTLEVRGFLVDGIVGPMTWQALVTEALSF